MVGCLRVWLLVDVVGQPSVNRDELSRSRRGACQIVCVSRREPEFLFHSTSSRWRAQAVRVRKCTTS